MPGIKLSNEYIDVLGDLFVHTPKAVLGAIVVSLLSSGGEEMDQVKIRLLNEWRILNENGIVPQVPCRAGGCGNTESEYDHRYRQIERRH